MEQEKATYEITFMCEVLKIKRAGYYAWLARRLPLVRGQRGEPG